MRDRQQEVKAIREAASRLLRGETLQEAPSRITVRALAAESGIPRWALYEHPDLLAEFKAAAEQSGAEAPVVQDLRAALAKERGRVRTLRAELQEEQAQSANLRRVVAELAIREALMAGDAVSRHTTLRPLPGEGAGG